MGYYFDHSNTDHTDLIAAYFGDTTVSEALANRAEDMVVDYYRVKLERYTVLYLANYDEDGLDEADDADFLKAFRNAVAHQIAWLQKKNDNDQMLQSHSIGKESKSYDTSILQRQYPPNFEQHLRQYDNLPIL